MHVKKEATRHVAMSDETAARLKCLGGTLKRGIYLASFSTDVNALLATEQKHRCPPVTTPAVSPALKPATSTRIAAENARRAHDPISSRINDDLKHYRAAGYTDLVGSDLTWELIAKMDKEIAEGVAPAQQQANPRPDSAVLPLLPDTMADLWDEQQ